MSESESDERGGRAGVAGCRNRGAPSGESRSAMPERLKGAARDDSSDDDWDPEEGAGASDDRRTAMQRTVVQMAAARSVVA